MTLTVKCLQISNSCRQETRNSRQGAGCRRTRSNCCFKHISFDWKIYLLWLWNLTHSPFARNPLIVNFPLYRVFGQILHSCSAVYIIQLSQHDKDLGDDWTHEHYICSKSSQGILHSAHTTQTWITTVTTGSRCTHYSNLNNYSYNRVTVSLKNYITINTSSCTVAGSDINILLTIINSISEGKWIITASLQYSAHRQTPAWPVHLTAVH